MKQLAMTGFVRIPFPSRRIYKDSLGELSARGKWLLARHKERVKRNPQFGPLMKEMGERIRDGEIGSYENVRFIQSPTFENERTPPPKAA